jgi:hypothetical protein
MKKWIPVGALLIGMALMYNTVPKYVTWFLSFILVTLILNKWDAIQKYFG